MPDGEISYGFDDLTRRRFTIVATLCVVLALAAVAPSNADAVVAQIADGSSVSYRPTADAAKAAGEQKALDSVFGFLDYGGGPVMPSNTNYTIYWTPAGAPAFPSGYTAGVDRYFADLAHDSTLPQTAGGAGRQNVDSIATQYGDSDGNFANYESRFGDGTHSSITDVQPYPTSGCTYAAICLTTSQIETEIARVVAAYNLPRDLSHQYFLVTPPGVENCFGSSGVCSAGSSDPYFCAYHGNIGIDNPIIYSVDPYVSAPDVNGCDDGNHPNGNAYDGLIQGGLTHEHNEAITDPIPNSAWTDWQSLGGGENGDKCGRDNGLPTGRTADGNYNQTINGNHYWYQEEWSNYGRACLQRLEAVPTLPRASFTTSKLGGNSVDFNVTTPPGDTAQYFYVWQFNDGGEQTVGTPGAQIQHDFPNPGVYRVGLTVINGSASYGASQGLAMNVEAANNQLPVVAFTAPDSIAPGVAANFDGSASTDSDGTIARYDWSWGDGSAVDSGVNPSHTFGSIGTYTVALTVTDSSGGISSLSRNVIVENAPVPKPSGPTNAPVPKPSGPTRSVLKVTTPSVHFSRSGTALLSSVTVGDAGSIDQIASARAGSKTITLCRVHRVAKRSATYRLGCALSKRARAALHKSALTVRLITKFRRARGGAPTTKSWVLKLARTR